MKSMKISKRLTAVGARVTWLDIDGFSYSARVVAVRGERATIVFALGGEAVERMDRALPRASALRALASTLGTGVAIMRGVRLAELDVRFGWPAIDDGE